MQEEPQNRGAWTYIFPQLLELLPKHSIEYAGREPSASAATGSLRVHREEQEAVITAALTGQPSKRRRPHSAVLRSVG